jgi:hypothetical protein
MKLKEVIPENICFHSASTRAGQLARRRRARPGGTDAHVRKQVNSLEAEPPPVEQLPHEQGVSPGASRGGTKTEVRRRNVDHGAQRHPLEPFELHEQHFDSLGAPGGIEQPLVEQGDCSAPTRTAAPRRRCASRSARSAAKTSPTLCLAAKQWRAPSS